MVIGVFFRRLSFALVIIIVAAWYYFFLCWIFIFQCCYKMTPESYLCLCLLILNGPINDIPILCFFAFPLPFFLLLLILFFVPSMSVSVCVFICIKKFFLTFFYIYFIYNIYFFGIHVVVESSFLSHVGIGLDPSFFNSFTNAVL